MRRKSESRVYGSPSWTHFRTLAALVITLNQLLGNWTWEAGFSPVGRDGHAAVFPLQSLCSILPRTIPKVDVLPSFSLFSMCHRLAQRRGQVGTSPRLFFSLCTGGPTQRARACFHTVVPALRGCLWAVMRRNSGVFALAEGVHRCAQVQPDR